MNGMDMRNFSSRTVGNPADNQQSNSCAQLNWASYLKQAIHSSRCSTVWTSMTRAPQWRAIRFRPLVLAPLSSPAGTAIPWPLSDQRPLPTNLPASLLASEGPSMYWHWKNLYNFEVTLARPGSLCFAVEHSATIACQYHDQNIHVH
jgi:hypothetical protein